MNRFALSDPFEEARTAISRRFLFVSTGVFGFAALLLATGPFPIPFRSALVARFSLTSERELALAAGMNDFLIKPIDAPRLRNILVATLDARRATRVP